MRFHENIRTGDRAYTYLPYLFYATWQEKAGLKGCLLVTSITDGNYAKQITNLLKQRNPC